MNDQENGFVAELEAKEEAEAQVMAAKILELEREFLSDEDKIHDIAMDLHSGRIFCNLFHLPPHEDQALPWMVLKLGGLPPETIRAWQMADVYTFWEYTSQAGPMAVNGVPQFFSMRLWTRAEVFAIVSELHRLMPKRYADPTGSHLDPNRPQEQAETGEGE